MPAGNTAVQAVYTHEIATSFDILKPEVWSSLMKSHGNQKADYFKMLTSLGFKVPSMNETFRHYEDDWIHVNSWSSSTNRSRWSRSRYHFYSGTSFIR